MSPRSKREYILRYLDETQNDMARALNGLERLKEIYQEQHPDITALMQAIQDAQLMVLSMLNDYRKNHA